MLTVPFRRKDVKNENPHQIFSIPHQIFLITSMTFFEFGTDATVGYTVRSNSCKRLSTGGVRSRKGHAERGKRTPRCCLWKGADSLSKHKSYGHCPLAAEQYHDNANAIVIEELFL